MEFNLVPVIQPDGTLKTNAAELLTAVQAELSKYDYVVDEESYSKAKEDRKKLNKIVSQIQASRMNLEEKVFGTWKADKASIMQVEKSVKTASETLGEGIQQVESVEKQKKYDALEAEWNSEGGVRFPFEVAFEKKWLNKTAKKAEIYQEMAAKLADLRAKENQLREDCAGLPDTERKLCFDCFYKTLDLFQAQQRANEYKAAMQEAAEREAQKAAEEAQRAAAGQQATIVSAAPVQPTAAPEMPAESIREPELEKMYRRAFLIEGSYSQMMELVQCMQRTGIRILDIAKGEKTSLGEKLPYSR